MGFDPKRTLVLYFKPAILETLPSIQNNCLSDDYSVFLPDVTYVLHIVTYVAPTIVF